MILDEQEPIEQPQPEQLPDEAPPFFGRWTGMYALVLGTLVGLIVLFFFLTLYYS